MRTRVALPSVVAGASPPVLPDRRGMLLSLGTLLCSAAAPCSRAQARLELPNKEVDNDTSPVIQEMLRRTAEKKEERYKQRLNDYYRRNFREYLEFDAGDPRLAERRGIKPETQAAINKWLEENK